MKIWSHDSTWNLVLPPSRPNDFQLSIIKNKIKSLPYDANVAVLGSTPEFRDLLFETNISNIYVFDKSIEFYKKMSSQRIYDNAEIFVSGNWLETLNGFNSYFDMVLSDLTAGNIEYEMRREFYRLIIRLLKENGCFIDKHLTNENGLLTLNEIQFKYSNLPVNLATVNDFSCEAIFCSELQAIPEVIDTTRIYRLLNKCFHKNKRLQKFVELAHLITPRDCFWYYGKSNIDYVEDMELEYKSTLSNTVYQNRAYVYIWRKKKSSS